ncbi:hypothetical protein A2U01_0018910, partial [Trifolium medium]|nr:hypothetical protein [Trifolium medium]
MLAKDCCFTAVEFEVDCRELLSYAGAIVEEIKSCSKNVAILVFKTY